MAIEHLTNELRDHRSETRDHRSETRDFEKEMRSDIKTVKDDVSSLRVEVAELKAADRVSKKTHWAWITALLAILAALVGWFKQ